MNTPTFDLDDDGVITDEEVKTTQSMIDIGLREEKAEAQRKMAWVAVLSMVAFMLLPIMPFVPDNRLETLASLSDMLFLSQASIVGFYFGATAYMNRK